MGNRILIISLVLVMVAAAVIAIGIVVWSFRGDGRGGGTAASPPPSASPAAEESPEPSPEPSTDADDLVNPGWKLATAEYYDFYYEVPYSDWRISPGRGNDIGFDEDDDGELDYVWEGASSYLQSPCDDWGARADVGAFGVLDSTDTEDSAPKVAERWGELGYSGKKEDQASSTEVRSVEPLEANGLSGHLAIVDVTVPDGLSECAPEKAVVYTAAFLDEEREGRLRTLSVVADAGVSDALSESRMRRIIESVRDIG
ncbi:hypothetical protein [Nocardiopsis potens]|uniref:hypothetical protein n=1 Tax=Nocardiopsis potens TaxID=1246458 RepID=UPI0003454826|nr:hypothetical protein [Nocardiopsis potens]